MRLAKGAPEVGRFDFEIARPEVAFTPDYMAYMEHGLGGDGDDYDVRYEATITRAAYYQYQAQDYERALDLYNQALALDEDYERRTGGKRLNDEIFFAKYETLSALGRQEEARATLKQAYSREIYSKSMKDKIEEAMQQEGML